MRGLTVCCALFSVPVPVPAAAAQALVRAVVLTSVGHLLRGDGAAGDAEPAESDAQMRKVIRAQQLYVRSNRTTKAVQAAIEASEAKANQAEADQAQTKAAVDEAPGASQETPEAAADEAGTPDTPDAADTTETDDAGKEDATTATTATTAEEAGVHAREGARKLLACLSMLPACYPHTSIPARSGHTHTHAHAHAHAHTHTHTHTHAHTHTSTHAHTRTHARALAVGHNSVAEARFRVRPGGLRVETIRSRRQHCAECRCLFLFLRLRGTSLLVKAGTSLDKGYNPLTRVANAVGRFPRTGGYPDERRRGVVSCATPPHHTPTLSIARPAPGPSGARP